MTRLAGALSVAVFATLSAAADEPLRIIVFGAHPDDCELKAGGVAARGRRRGTRSSSCRVTNGDIGHWRDVRRGPGPAAQGRGRGGAPRSSASTPRCSTSTTASCMPTLENRRTITRLIREWKADVVMSPPAQRLPPRPPLHRRARAGRRVHGHRAELLPGRAAPCKKNPVFLFYSDHFQKPNPFQPGRRGGDRRGDREEARRRSTRSSRSSTRAGRPASPGCAERPGRPGEAAREVRADRAGPRPHGVAERFRDKLAEWYGKERAAKVEHAEAFEVCEYGRQPTAAELRTAVPVLRQVNRGPARPRCDRAVAEIPHAAGVICLDPPFLACLPLAVRADDPPRVVARSRRGRRSSNSSTGHGSIRT